MAIEFADRAYSVSRTFPTDERFGLVSQLRRAAVSIAANLAEGSGRGSNKDFARFVEIAFSSLMECVSHYEIAKRQRFIEEPDHASLYALAQRLSRVLSGLRSSLELKSS